MEKRITLIAAIQAKDRGIGFDDRLLFRIKDDMQRFKGLTLGKPIIMGRKTFESIGSKALKNRTNIVVSRTLHSFPEGIMVVSGIAEAMILAEDSPGDEIFVIGGGEIYKQLLPRANKLELTIVESGERANVFFPEYGEFQKEVFRSDHHDLETGFDYSFVTLER